MDTPDAFTTVEATGIYWWHMDYFRALDFNRHQADILVLADIDPHELDDLLKAGCPRDLELLIDILS